MKKLIYWSTCVTYIRPTIKWFQRIQYLKTLFCFNCSNLCSEF